MASADKRALADGFAIGQYLSPRRAAAMERSGAGERSEPEERSVMAAARGYSCCLRLIPCQGFFRLRGNSTRQAREASFRSASSARTREQPKRNA